MCRHTTTLEHEMYDYTGNKWCRRNSNIIIMITIIIIGVTGTISKTFRKYVSNIPGNHKVKELQRTAILGTAHILRKVLM